MTPDEAYKKFPDNKQEIQAFVEKTYNWKYWQHNHKKQQETIVPDVKIGKPASDMAQTSKEKTNKDEKLKSSNKKVAKDSASNIEQTTTSEDSLLKK